jgi:hypothetical protein
LRYAATLSNATCADEGKILERMTSQPTKQ